MLLILCALLAASALADEIPRANVCYGEYGCFTNSAPFSGGLTSPRPVALLPESPEKIGTTFKLYNRQQHLGVAITAKDIPDAAQYDPTIGTKILVHGFMHASTKPWMTTMRDSILRVDDVNVIAVDWSKGNGFPYTRATANSQIVGVEIAFIVEALIAQGANIEDIHIIGHSLGAHIAGYAGKKLKGLGRISGLDPAGPYFENTDPVVRLTQTDAKFIDVIHSDGTATIKAGLGLMQPLGHADFYPNGGINQPDCPTTSSKFLQAIWNAATLDYDGIEASTGCSHSAAVNFFLHSIENKDTYTSYPCANAAEFEGGRCIAACAKGCNKMGYWASAEGDLGTLYLNTLSPTALTPTSKQNYAVSFVSDKSSGSHMARGYVKMYFRTKHTQSAELNIDEKDGTFKVDSVEQRLMSLAKPIRDDGPILSAFVTYKRTSNPIVSWMYDSEWLFKRIDILDGETRATVRLCHVGMVSASKGTIQYTTCP